MFECFLHTGWPKPPKAPMSRTAVAMAKLATLGMALHPLSNKQIKLLHVQLAATLDQDKDPLSH